MTDDRYRIVESSSPVIPDLTVAELAEASGISARKGKERERSERVGSFFVQMYITKRKGITFVLFDK